MGVVQAIVLAHKQHALAAAAGGGGGGRAVAGAAGAVAAGGAVVYNVVDDEPAPPHEATSSSHTLLNTYSHIQNKQTKYKADTTTKRAHHARWSCMRALS